MWMHRSMSHRCDNHPSKNCLKPRNFSQCPLWSSIPTARCKPRFLQLETLPQYVSHKALAQERSSTQSTTKKKEGGILISVKVLSLYIQVYTWYLRKTGSHSLIISNDSTISSRLQMKTQPYRPIPQ